MRMLGIVPLLAALALPACGTSPQPAAPAAPAVPYLLAAQSAPGANGYAWRPDTIVVLDVDGRVKARDTFAARNMPYPGSAVVRLQPVAQAVGSTVYYIDGYGTVRALTIGAQPRVVATFAQEPGQYETWFAVSPDGTRVMAGLLTFPAIGPAASGMPWPTLVGNWKFDLELSISGAAPVVLEHTESAEHPDNPTATWKPTFPVAWTSRGPVAMVPQWIATQNAWYGGRLYLMDAQGNRVTQLGGADCSSAAVNPAGLIACIAPSTNAVTVRDSGGNVIWTPTSVRAFDALQISLSPDGHGITDGQTVETTAGKVTLPEGFWVEGWLDDATIVGRVADPSHNSLGNLAWISIAHPATVHDLGVVADYIAPVTPPA